MRLRRTGRSQCQLELSAWHMNTEQTQMEQPILSTKHGNFSPDIAKVSEVSWLIATKENLILGHAKLRWIEQHQLHHSKFWLLTPQITLLFTAVRRCWVVWWTSSTFWLWVDNQLWVIQKCLKSSRKSQDSCQTTISLGFKWQRLLRKIVSINGPTE